MKQILAKGILGGLFFVSSILLTKENVSAQISGPYQIAYTQQGQVVGLFCDPYQRCQWQLLVVPNNNQRSNQASRIKRNNLAEACRRASYSTSAAQMFYWKYGQQGIDACRRLGFGNSVQQQYDRGNRLSESTTNTLNESNYGKK